MGWTVNPWLAEFDPQMRSQDAHRRFTVWQDVPLDPRNDASQTAT